MEAMKLAPPHGGKDRRYRPPLSGVVLSCLLHKPIQRKKIDPQSQATSHLLHERRTAKETWRRFHHNLECVLPSSIFKTHWCIVRDFGDPGW